jgi:hypothetical protein
MGIRAITVEGISPVGIGRSGMADNMTENRRASFAVAGQNDWSWWVGHEDMLVDTTFMVQPHPSRSPRELREQSFRALANRSLLIFDGHGEADAFPASVERMGPYYRMYNQVAPLMRQRRLLPGQRGVEWQGEGNARALFAYAAFDYPLPAGARVERVDGDSAAPVAVARTLKTKPYTAYRIVPAGA